MNRPEVLVAAVLLVFLLGSVGALGQQPAEPLVKVRDHEGAGVKSEIYVRSFGEDDHKGSTDDNGIRPVPSECLEGEVRVVAKPINRFYSQNGKTCRKATDVEILVIPKAYLALLDNKADQLETDGELAAAAMVLTDASSLAMENTGEALTAPDVRALVLFGQYLGLDSKESVTFDPDQERLVMSGSLQQALFRFQGSRGLELTGRLDYQTLRAAAGKDLREIVPDSSASVNDQ